MTNHPPLELIDVFASTVPSLSFPTRPARQLCRDSTSHARRTAEVQGFSRRDRRIRHIEPTGKEEGITKIGKDSYPTAEQAEADVKRLCKSQAKPKRNP